MCQKYAWVKLFLTIWVIIGVFYYLTTPVLAEGSNPALFPTIGNIHLSNSLDQSILGTVASAASSGSFGSLGGGVILYPTSSGSMPASYQQPISSQKYGQPTTILPSYQTKAPGAQYGTNIPTSGIKPSAANTGIRKSSSDSGVGITKPTATSPSKPAVTGTKQGPTKEPTTGINKPTASSGKPKTGTRNEPKDQEKPLVSAPGTSRATSAKEPAVKTGTGQAGRPAKGTGTTGLTGFGIGDTEPDGEFQTNHPNGIPSTDPITGNPKQTFPDGTEWTMDPATSIWTQTRDPNLAGGTPIGNIPRGGMPGGGMTGGMYSGGMPGSEGDRSSAPSSETETQEKQETTPGTDVIGKIHENLVGSNLKYRTTTGEIKEVKISKNDLGNIEPATYKGEKAWQLFVNPAFRVTFDATGDNILDETQIYKP